MSMPTPDPPPHDTPTAAGPAAGPAVADGAAPRLATGRYQFNEEIGRGGMGVIVRGWDGNLHRELAFKILHGHLADDPSAVRRFQEEARILGRLQHPGVVPVHEVGTLPGGPPFFAMKLVQGRTLREHLDQRPSPAAEVPRLLKVFEQVCQTLAYAHAHGVIHRDLKPANVMVGEFGEVQVMDWGLAKVLAADGRPAPHADAEDPLATVVVTGQGTAEGKDGSETQAGCVLGTFAYMPPEQARGQVDQIDRRSDVFGLGAILCEVLTGDPPYAGRDREALRVQALVADLAPVFERLQRSGVDGDLLALARRCLAADPSDRFADAGQVAQAVTHYLTAAEERARQAEVELARAETQTREQQKRRRILAVSLLTVTVGAVVAALWIDDARRRATGALKKEGDARAAESRATEQAREATAEAKYRLTRLHIATGTQAQERGEPFTALLWYARAWQADPEPENEPGHRTRLGTVLGGVPRLAGVCVHPAEVDDVDLNRACTRLVTRTATGNGPRNNVAYVWDFALGKLATPPLLHAGPVRHVEFSPDGSRILTASEDRTAALWDAATGRRLRTLTHDAPVVAASYSPDGKTMATAAGKQVILWDADTGERAAGPIDCPADVWAVQFSRAGGRLVTADRGGHARVWEAASGKPSGPPLPQRVPNENESRFYKFGPALSPDGRQVLTTRGGGFAGQVHEVDTGKEVWKVLTQGVSHGWSPDGRKAVVGFQPQVVDAGTGKVIRKVAHAREVGYVALTPDGQTLVSGMSGGGIHLWDLTTGQLRCQPLQCADFLRRLRVSADGRWLVACSRDGTARVWDLSA
ncbi:MAG: protein kinase domain-containing protein, partial [Gemmataceae bacterium]